MLRLTPDQAAKLGLNVAACTPFGKAASVRNRQRTRMPDDILWDAVSAVYPEAQREYQGVVPGRRFRIDIALPDLFIAIEVDGWSHHGQHRKAHAADRVRQNLVAVQGWMILRFTAGQIFKELEAVMALIEAAVQRQHEALCAIFET